MDNFTVVYENLPCKVGGFTMHNPIDDFFTIVLNQNMSYYANQKTFAHEIAHIRNDDFELYKNVGQIERNLHQ